MAELATLLKGSTSLRTRSEPMSRRFSIYGLALVCSVCLLVVLVSHRLINSPSLDRPPFVDIGRTIQSWSSNDLDGTNIPTDSINDVIAAQRKLLAEEMEGYPYPAGRFNINATSLNQLVPELGGQPIRNLVITTWRSGSTFLGDVLNSHPANFYHYEPLLDNGIIQIRREPLASGALRTLKNLLNCDYSEMGRYLDYGQEHVWLFTHNTRLWNQCHLHPQLCWLPEFLTPFCQLFPFQSMKVVRLRLRLIEEILEDPRLNVRVLYLVRDPRGTLQSRKHRDWCPGFPDCSEASRLCNDLVADFNAATQLTAKFPSRFRVIRYEDFSIEPFKGTQELFDFFGLDFHKNVQEFLDTHTKIDAGGVSSTFRNSKSAPFHWRQELTHLEVRSIQKTCRWAMDLWGYRRTFNSSHQRDFNPLRDFMLT